MSEATLTHIAAATKKTIDERHEEFEIVEIDTTEMKTRDCVTKIARSTLSHLKVFLDEAVCVVPAGLVSLQDRGFFEKPLEIENFLDCVKDHREFVPRSVAEQNPNYIQPIPMAILEYGDEILLLKRNKVGHPLHDKYDVWSGGHVNEGDNGEEILLNALNREITEEVFIKDSYELDKSSIALLRTNEDARASLHVGVLYRLQLKSDDVALALNQKEFRATRGSSMSGRLVKTSELAAFYENMGDWSKFITQKLWPESVPASNKSETLF